MESEREKFINKINKFIFLSKNSDFDIIKSYYLNLVKEYHPDKNHKIGKNILNEYMIIINNIYEEMEKNSNKININNDIHNKKYFYIITFCRLLSKIEIIHTNRNETNFNKIRNDFITEINKYDQNVGKSFSLILFDEIIIKKDFEIFLNGIICYERVFNNLYSYTQYYIDKNIKSAVNYFNNFKNKNTQELQNSIEIIKEWFNKLLNKIV